MSLFDPDDYFPQSEPTKVCSDCGKRLPVRAFSVKETYYPSMKQRLRSECKACARTSTRIRNDAARNHITRTGLCPTCDSHASLVIDHCHDTGMVRGRICGDCNTALGMAKDDPVILGNLITYLLKAKEHPG